MDVRILVSVSTKSKYSILKYICSLSFGYLKQPCCMGITLITKEITPKNTGTRDELSITLYLQSEINFCSVRMPVIA